MFERPRLLCSRLLLLLAGLAVATGTATGAAGSWNSIGPEGGNVSEIAVNPANPAVALAVIARSGIYKTNDGGVTWTPANSGLIVPDGIGQTPFSGLASIAVDASNPTTVFAGGGPYLYRSDDGGANWTWVTAFPALTSGNISRIVIDPGSPTRIYVGTSRRLLRSTDGGVSWTQIHSFSPSDIGPGVTAIVVDPTNRDVIYVGSRAGMGSIKSTNGGVTWTNLGVASYSLALASPSPATLYSAFYGFGVRKSTDGGAIWVLMNTGLDLRVRFVAVDPAAANTVYAATDGGILKSVDGATNWAPAGVGLTTAFFGTLTTVSTSPTTLYAGSLGAGIFKSGDAAASWFPRNSGLVATRPQQMLASGGVLLATLENFGVARKPLSGSAWSTSADGLVFPQFYDLAAAPSSPLVLFASAYGGIFKSSDGGATWSNKNPDGYLGATAAAIHPNDPSIVYAAFSTNDGSSVLKSTDGGEKWTPASSGLTPPPGNSFFSVSRLAFDPLVPSTLYAATNWGVFKTTSGGASWFPINNGGSQGQIDTILVNPVAPGTVYALTANEILKTVNGGDSWTSIHSLSFATALAINPSNPSELIAGSSLWGIRRSPDGGTTWEDINGSLTNRRAISLVFDPGNPARVFAGIDSAGVFSLDLPLQPIPSAFYTLTPCRVVDTRNADGTWGGPSLAAGSDRVFQLVGVCGIPVDARAVALNVTVTGSDGSGHLTAHAGFSAVPASSSINYRAGQTRANNAVLPLGPGGTLAVFCGQPSGTTHVIIDVTGYFE